MLKFEFKRLVCDRKNIYFAFIILLVSLYFVNSGINELRQFEADKIQLIETEKERISNYPSYKHYGGYGFRVLFQPSPINLFFNNNTVLFDIEGKVNNTELFQIYNQFKGKKLFYNRGYFKDFSGFIYFIGSLLMIYMGIVGIRSLNRLKLEMQFISIWKLFFQSTVCRLLILNFFFSIIASLSYLFAYFRGIPISATQFHHFIIFIAYTVLLLNFFYMSGLFLALLLKLKKTSFIWMFILWLFFIFLAPDINRLILFEDTKHFPSNSAMEVQKIKIMMDFEKKADSDFRKWNKEQNEKIKKLATNDKMKQEMLLEKDQNKRKLFKTFIESFLVNYHTLIKNREYKVNKEIKQAIEVYEKRSVLFPTFYYFFLSAEMSSKGYFGYLDFKYHMINTQENFLRYCLDRAYVNPEKIVKDFVKNGENIFKARSHMPRTLWWASVLTLFYTLIMAALAYAFLKRLVYLND